tara:strand:- start:3188 stop:3871 length:684 start_codon:yes stop_codon:yes gene_type:complete
MRIVFWFLFSFLGFSSAFALPEPQVIRHLPAEPQVLLDVLPSAPKGWELERSEAAHEYSGIVTSKAIRVFAEALKTGLEGVEPTRVRVEIRDTCNDPTLTAMFKLKKEDLRSEELRPGHWRSNPAILIDELDGVNETVRVLFEDRFLVKVTYQGKDYRAARLWLQSLDIEALKQYQPYVFREPPASFLMKRINEFKWKGVRSYLMPIPGQMDTDPLEPIRGTAISKP